MSDMRKLIESLDLLENQSSPAKEKAFRALGLDEHQREVFELTWDYCVKYFNPEAVARRQAMRDAQHTGPRR